MRPGFMGDVVGAKSFIGSHGLLRRSWIAPDRRKAEYGTQLTAKALRSIHSASARVGSEGGKAEGTRICTGLHDNPWLFIARVATNEAIGFLSNQPPTRSATITVATIATTHRTRRRRFFIASSGRTLF